MKVRRTYQPVALSGFTLIELLVVISIIAVLATMVMAVFREAIVRAKVASTVTQVDDLRTQIAIYVHDTGEYPSVVCNPGCPASSDPLLTAPAGTTGWNGPYLPGFADQYHAWNGHITYNIYNESADCVKTNQAPLHHFIVLDEDHASGDNKAPIPYYAMLRLDGVFDDGSLTTGNMRGNSPTTAGFCTAYNEMSLKLD